MLPPLENHLPRCADTPASHAEPQNGSNKYFRGDNRAIVDSDSSQ